MRVLFALLVHAVAVSMAAAQRPPERYVVISNGERIGHLHVTRSGRRVETDFFVDNNGRGPKIRETWELADDGLPVQLTLEGTTTFGSRTRETFRRRNGHAEWRTLSDRGSTPAPRPGVYVPIESSPYYLALALPALLAASERTLPVWPAGEIRAERVRDLAEGAVWAIWGLDLRPVFVLTDAQGQWSGALAGWYVVVPEGRQGEAPELTRLAVALETELLAALSARLAHRWDRPVQLRDVRVLDPVTGTLSAPTTVVAYHGRITAVAPDLPPPSGAVVIDGEGGTLVPGLHDLHTHYSSWDGPLHLAAGVTTVRDMGNDNAVLDAAVRRLEAGTIMGPRIVRSGFIEGRSPFSAKTGFVADSLAAALEQVRWYGTHGYHQVKVYSSTPPDWVAPIAAEAHRLGMSVAGHVPAFSSAPRVVRDGYDEITHVNQLVLSFLIDTDREDTRTPFRFTALGRRTGALRLDDPGFDALVTEMASRGVAHDPTLATFGSLLLARSGRVTPMDAPWLEHMPVTVQRMRKVTLLDIRPGDDTLYHASAARLREVVKLLFDRGVRLVPGTDDLAGVTLLSELQEWQRAGIPPADVVRLATAGAAEHLGLEREVGTIARGRRADLLLVPGDPTQDLSVLRQARLVMKDGVVFFPDEIHQALGVQPFGARPAVRKPSVP